jgi:hypothetical protein
VAEGDLRHAHGDRTERIAYCCGHTALWPRHYGVLVHSSAARLSSNPFLEGHADFFGVGVGPDFFGVDDEGGGDSCNGDFIARDGDGGCGFGEDFNGDFFFGIVENDAVVFAIGVFLLEDFGGAFAGGGEDDALGKTSCAAGSPDDFGRVLDYRCHSGFRMRDEEERMKRLWLGMLGVEDLPYFEVELPGGGSGGVVPFDAEGFAGSGEAEEAWEVAVFPHKQGEDVVFEGENFGGAAAGIGGILCGNEEGNLAADLGAEGGVVVVEKLVLDNVLSRDQEADLCGGVAEDFEGFGQIGGMVPGNTVEEAKTGEVVFQGV